MRYKLFALSLLHFLLPLVTWGLDVFWSINDDAGVTKQRFQFAVHEASQAMKE
jgi:hypothetical protein